MGNFPIIYFLVATTLWADLLSAQLSTIRPTCGPIDICIRDPEKPCPTNLECTTVTDTRTVYPTTTETTSTYWVTKDHTLTITKSHLSVNVSTTIGSTIGFCEIVTPTEVTEIETVTVWKTATETKHKYTTTDKTDYSVYWYTSTVQSDCVSAQPTELPRRPGVTALAGGAAQVPIVEGSRERLDEEDFI